MMNPGWASTISMHDDLTENGVVAVVDFRDLPLRLFKAQLRFKCTRLDDHLLTKLERRSRWRVSDLLHAYSGAWSYLLFLPFIREQSSESK